MLDGAEEQVVIGEDVSASGADAEVLGRQLRGQARDLRELPEGPLFFGKLDFAPGGGEHAGQKCHIGRLRITEHPAAPPLVVDWRAPVSRAFYQASAREPQGVAVRRCFGWAPGSRGDSADLTGLEDEHIGGGRPERDCHREPDGHQERDHEGHPVPESRIPTGEIERPRVGPMRDIAATIQPEQDHLVRGDLAEGQGAAAASRTGINRSSS
jgi:hypothetical protein